MYHMNCLIFQCYMYWQLHVWQSQVENEHYSVFNHMVA